MVSLLLTKAYRPVLLLPDPFSHENHKYISFLHCRSGFLCQVDLASNSYSNSYCTNCLANQDLIRMALPTLDLRRVTTFLLGLCVFESRPDPFNVLDARFPGFLSLSRIHGLDRGVSLIVPSPSHMPSRCHSTLLETRQFTDKTTGIRQWRYRGLE